MMNKEYVCRHCKTDCIAIKPTFLSFEDGIKVRNEILSDFDNLKDLSYLFYNSGELSQLESEKEAKVKNLLNVALHRSSFLSPIKFIKDNAYDYYRKAQQITVESLYLGLLLMENEFKLEGEQSIYFTNDKLRSLALGSLVHDIGMLNIPSQILEDDEIFRSKGKEIMKAHIACGPRVLKSLECCLNTFEKDEFGKVIRDKNGEASSIENDILKIVRGHHLPAYGIHGDEITPLTSLMQISEAFVSIANRNEAPIIPIEIFNIISKENLDVNDYSYDEYMLETIIEMFN